MPTAGCIIQDMGYYPFGSKFFSDLVHYVRTGDFIVNLIREAQTLNEFAFALGALAHYAADTQGHSVAVNRSVALEYPKLARKYGKVRDLCRRQDLAPESGVQLRRAAGGPGQLRAAGVPRFHRLRGGEGSVGARLSRHLFAWN